MEVKRVSVYRSPAYPDKGVAQKNPSTLKTLPERWKGNAAACAALAATSAMLLASCSIPAGGDDRANKSKAIAVPFFEHGNGRGSIGCVAVAPPAFLGESEAFGIIREIAGKEGLSFVQNEVEIENVGIPVTSTYPDPQGAPAIKNGTLLLDGADPDKKIAFEYVSTEDIESWEKKQDNWCSVSSYDFAGTARALNGSLNKAEPGITVAVFYDPNHNYDDEVKQIISDSGDDYNAMERKLRELAKEDLRAQVRDFIAWLKAEGII